MHLQNAQFTNILPPKAGNGLDGSQTGGDGGHGQKGKDSPDITIIAKQLLQGSSIKLNYASRGGEGGNGGTGKTGTAGSESGLVPTDCSKLMKWPGSDSREHDSIRCSHECCFGCNCCEFDKEHWKYIDTRAACGTAGPIFAYRCYSIVTCK